MSDESKKYISVIFKEWLPLYDGLTPEVKAILKNIAAEQSEAWPLVFMTSFFRIRISPAI
jgi:diguanylate cyclase